MSTTAVITAPSGQILEIRHVDVESWTHAGPIEFGRYASDQNGLISELLNNRDVLYHYTNLQSLYGIVREGTIWASDVRVMNDRAELTYALGEMRALANTAQSSVSSEMLDSVFDPARTWQFAASFSCSRDQLSQWRAYAYGARVGVSIGFSRTHLTRAIEAQQGRIVDCRYFERRDFLSLRGEIEDMVGVLEASKGKLSDAEEKNLASRAVHLASNIKHKSFAEEQEARLIVAIERVSERVQFRPSLHALTPYVKIDLDGRRFGAAKERFANHLGMMEILVWPSDADSQVLDAIDMLLSPAGGVLIRRSASPYRT
jgi:hypothetical protein